MTITRMTRRAALWAGTAATFAFGGLAPAWAQDEETLLRFMSWGGAVTIAEIAAEVEEQLPDVAARFQVEAVDGGPIDQDVAAALRLALASGEDLPDIVMLNRTQVPEFAASGELMPLDELFAEVGEDLYPGALELARVGEEFYAVPFELKSKLFYYRADLFEAAGVDPNALGTVEEFLAAARAIDEMTDAHILNLGPQPFVYWLGEIVSAYEGARYFADAEGNYELTTNPAYREAFEFLKALHDSGAMLPVDDWSSDWQPAIAEGRVAAFLSANWLKQFLPQFAPDQAGQWRVALWPELAPLADQRYGSEAGGSVFVVPRRAENAEAAVEYLREVFLTPEGAMAVFDARGLTPLIQSAREEYIERSTNPVRPEGMSDEEWAQVPAVFFGPELAQVELESYEYVRVLDYDPAASKGLDIINQWLRAYLAGEVTVDEALENAQADMASQIGNPYDY